jgi:hypothetical protein
LSGPKLIGGFWPSAASPEQFIPRNCGQFSICAFKGFKMKKLKDPKRKMEMKPAVLFFMINYF